MFYLFLFVSCILVLIIIQPTLPLRMPFLEFTSKLFLLCTLNLVNIIVVLVNLLFILNLVGQDGFVC